MYINLLLFQTTVHLPLRTVVVEDGVTQTLPLSFPMEEEHLELLYPLAPQEEEEDGHRTLPLTVVEVEEEEATVVVNLTEVNNRTEEVNRNRMAEETDTDLGKTENIFLVLRTLVPKRNSLVKWATLPNNKPVSTLTPMPISPSKQLERTYQNQFWNSLHLRSILIF